MKSKAKFAAAIIFSLLLITSCTTQKYFLVVNESPSDIEVNLKTVSGSNGYFSFNPVIADKTAKIGKEVLQNQGKNRTGERILLPAQKALIIGSINGREAAKLQRSPGKEYNLESLGIKSKAGAVKKEGTESLKMFFRNEDGNFTILITN